MFADAGRAAKTTRNLGVDFTGAKPLRGRLAPVRKQRLCAFAAKQRRLFVLSKAKRKLGAQVFCSGLMPWISYDHIIFGLRGKPLSKLRNHVGKHLGITGPWRSTDLGFLFHANKDPEPLAASRVLERFLREAWRASLFGRHKDDEVIPLGVSVQ